MATAARPTRPGQLRPSQVTTTSAATASTRGMGEREPQHPPDQPEQLDDQDHAARGCGRPGTATPGRRTGRGCRPGRAARPSPSYGRAALDSPPLTMRQQGETPGAAGMPVPAAPPTVTIRPPHHPCGSGRPCSVALAVAVVMLGVQPLDLSGELGRLAGQLPGELHRCRRRSCGRRWTSTPWSTRTRCPGSACGRRRCSGTSTSPRRRSSADVCGRSAAAPHAATSLASWPGRPRPGARMPVALSE